MKAYYQQKLRWGYTTGSCAAAAAKGAAAMLLSGKPITHAEIDTPKGIHLSLPLESIEISKEVAQCAVRKDSGDDPDVTNGILIHAAVRRNPSMAIKVTGGRGIGRVTKPGLSVPVGESAINPIPMKMIVNEVKTVCKQHNYEGGLDIEIFAPEGEQIAEKTFNPRLGIIGGISILGTTGIVEPMSEKAILDTIYLEMNQQRKLGSRHLLLCPGNYGRDFIKNELRLDIEKAVKCSNFIGEAIDFAAELGFESILLIGHAGKLVKLAAGVMNTHSKVADVRMEVMALYTALCGGGIALTERILACITTDEAIKILQQHNLLEKVFQKIMEKTEAHLSIRVKDITVGAVIFSNQFGILGMTQHALKLIQQQKG